MITVGDAIAGSFRELVGKEVAGALTPEALSEMLLSVVKAYAADDGGTGSLELLLNPEQQERIRDHFVGQYGDALAQGVEIKGDGSIIAGFKVSVVDQNVQHDFSAEAICDAICALLRPHLAEIVRNAQQ